MEKFLKIWRGSADVGEFRAVLACYQTRNARENVASNLIPILAFAFRN